MTTALFNKYKIEKNDGSPTDPNAMYFVLRIDTDEHARAALWVYAARMRDINPELARDLFNTLAKFNDEEILEYAGL